MAVIKRVFVVVVVLLVCLCGWAYSWTFTPEGRLDFPAAVIAKLSSINEKPLILDLATVADARHAANEQMGMMLRNYPVAEGVTITDLRVPGQGGDIRVRYYRPQGEGVLPALIWIHGGGFWMGNKLEDWDGRVAALARDAEVATFSVDYRLAPEHPWPAAVDDSYSVLLWLHAQGAAMDVDVSRIAVGGGSAGGNLAAVLALKARDEGGPAIAAQLLSVPATDATARIYPSDELFASGYVLTASSIAAMLNAYLPNPEDRQHPYASPIMATSHADLPPALIMTAQFDPLRDEGEAYGEALAQAGVEVEVVRYDGALHGFMGSVDALAASHDAQVALLRRVFNGN